MPIGKVNNTEHDVKYLAPKTGLVKTLRPPEETVSPSTPFAIVPMTYNGGGILAAPEIVALYWGNFAASDIDAMQAWFAGWAGYIGNAIAPAGLDQVLLQYGVYSASVGVYYNDVAAPANATDTDVMNEVIALQGAGNLPAFADNRIFVVMTKGIIFSGYGTVWCAYHGKWAANSYYAICPYPTAGGCEPTPTALGNLQYAVSHEIQEAATDPTPGTGWVEGGGEGGDGCNQQTVNMPFGVLQRFADNLQNACSVWTTHNDQNNWRWCNKCQGMYFGGNPGSVCPTGGSHDATGSGDYNLVQNSGNFAGQANWAWCNKCQGLYFAGNNAGTCPAGGGHDDTGSGNYILRQD